MAYVVDVLVEVLKNTVIPALPESYEQEQARAMVAVLRSIPVENKALDRVSQEKVALIEAQLQSLSFEVGLTPPRPTFDPKESPQDRLEHYNMWLSTAIRESCGNSQRDELRRKIRNLLRQQIDWEMSHQNGQRAD